MPYSSIIFNIIGERKMVEYVRGKVYYLSAPSDGQNMETGQVARYPVGLPVKFIQKKKDRFIVVEPKGSAAAFPLRPVWSMGQTIDIFSVETGFIGEKPTLAAYDSEEAGESEWERYSNPVPHRWYFDILRASQTEKHYADWECGWGSKGIENILEAGKLILEGEDQEYINAVLDIALLFYEDDAPRWYEEQPEQEGRNTAFLIVETVHSFLRCSYIVKSDCTWDLEGGKLINSQGGNMIELARKSEEELDKL